jgi:hypothetical protein
LHSLADEKALKLTKESVAINKADSNVDFYGLFILCNNGAVYATNPILTFFHIGAYPHRNAAEPVCERATA